MNRRQARANKKQLKIGVKTLNKSGSCGECRECCKNLTIDKLLKPEGKACRFLRPNAQSTLGCVRYETRPDACRYFMCVWRFEAGWLESLRPDRSGVMLFPVYEGPVFSIRAMARTEAELEAALPWLVEYAARRGMAITCRIVGEKKEWVYGNAEQVEQIVKSKKHLRIVQG